MKPIDAEKNALDATKALLDFGKVPATRLGLREALWQHPDFPSLSSLSDVLNDFQVPNLSARLTPDHLHEIPLPALTYLNIDGGIFAPLRSVNGQVEWLHTQRGWQKESLGNFARKWSGVTLLIEPSKQSGERDYAQNRRRETLGVLRMAFIVGAIFTILGLLLWSALQTFPWAEYSAYYLIGVTKLVGTIVSGMLVWYSLDTQNEFLQRVCQIGNRSNCQNILSSSAAKLIDWLSWAEIGLFYFAGGLLALATGLGMGDREFLASMGRSLYLLALLALPYTIWSVYYQWQVAREWCILCLTVQGLLWLEFYLVFEYFGLPEGAESWLTNNSVLVIGLVCFLITPLLWIWAKPHLQQAVLYSPILQEFQKIKFDPNYLEGLVSKSRPIPPVFEGMKVISLGNSNAENSLILVANPTCVSCRRYYVSLKKHLEYNDNLHVQIILGTSLQDKGIAGKVARQILDLPIDEMGNALSEWFEMDGVQYNTWKHKTNGDYRSETAVSQLIMHNRWLELSGVTQIPASFLNMVELPKYYYPHEFPRLCTYISQFRNRRFK